MSDFISSVHVVLGFDFGLKRIGVAVGQSITRTAQALTTLNAKQGAPDWHTLDKLVREWQPTVFVCGHPLDMQGNRQDITKAAEAFAAALEKRYGITVHLVDERLSSAAAKDYLIEMETKKTIKSQIDKVAAKLIIETWFRDAYNSTR